MKVQVKCWLLTEEQKKKKTYWFGKVEYMKFYIHIQTCTELGGVD